MKMYPNIIKPDAPNSEKKVFEKFKKELPDDWIGIHSYVIDNEEHREVDFIIVVPQRGIFVLEVKGGRITVQNRNWYTGNRNGITLLGTPPHIQAERYQHILIDILKNNGLGYIPVGYGVVFPDCDFLRYSGNLIELNKERIIDRTKLIDNVQDNINNLINFNLEQIANLRNGNIVRNEFNERSFERVVEFLIGQQDGFILVDINTENQYIVNLTHNQYMKYKNIIQANNKVMVTGPAGTGKTIIGFKVAHHYLKNNIRVGFFCYNELLGNYIKSQFRNNQNVKAGTIYGFMLDVISLAGLKQNFDNECANADDNRKYGDLYFKYFKEACGFLRRNNNYPQFDLLIVDEMQDLSYQRYLDVFNMITHQNSKIIFLADYENQNILRRYPDYVNLNGNQNYTNVPLFENCRNTYCISQLTQILANVQYDRILNENEIKVQIGTYVDREQFLRKLNNCIEQLINEGTRVDDITILTMKKLKESLLNENIINNNGRFYYNFNNNRVRFETVRRYKGLENKIIMVVDLDPNLNPDTRQWLYYVAFTRAKIMLYVFKPSGFDMGDLQDIAEYI